MRPVHVRHVIDGDQTADGAVAVLGRYFVPQDRRGVNGRNGYQEGTTNRKAREESDFTITFPNDVGGDQVKHLERFLILALRNVAGRDYKIGDEWLEVYAGDPPGGDLIALGAPVDYTITKTSIELQCKDALKTLAHVRETAGGAHWCHAPRDAIEHYTEGWTSVLLDDFPQDGRFTWDPGSIRTTADGKWSYRAVQHAAAGLGSQVEILAGPAGGLATVATGEAGALSAVPHQRLEATITLSGYLTAGDQFEFIFSGTVPGHVIQQWTMQIRGDGQVLLISPDAASVTSISSLLVNTTHRIALEMRERWAYYYLDGTLLGVLPAGVAATGMALNFNMASGGLQLARVDSFSWERARPYLLRGSDKGDYRLPGAPPPGALLGSYFSEVDTSNTSLLLSPLKAPYKRRLDTAINFPAPGGTPNAWQPPATPNGERFSVRWTGAIYLDDPSTWKLRVTATDRVRVWVGKTRFGEQIIDDWTNAGHAAMTTTTAAATLAGLGTAAGWYPIVIEYSEDTGVGGCILEAQKGAGAWVVPGTAGAPQLSPLGIFEDHVRGESHYTMVKQLCDTFGYQYRCDPMPLESGEFPGRVAPRVRVGADYDLTATEDDSTSLQAQGSAEDCVDVLIADAQGLADPAGTTQLTAEVVNYDQAGKHLILHKEAESLAEVATEQLLLQRLNSLLGLRSSPWEQVSAVVATESGERVLVPLALTGALAAIAWEPGDGVYRDYPTLGVKDLSPVQITSVSRKFVPDALGLPGVSFRPRPRSFRDFLTRLQRTIVSPQRNYQGQLATRQGSLGSNSASVAPDAYSRIALPANLDDVAAARLFVITKSDASPWDIEINGTVVIPGITVPDPDGYDVKPWVARAVATEPRMYARLAAGGGSTGSWQIQLELTVRI